MSRDDELGKAYEVWKTKPTPDNLAVTLDVAEPVIRNALTSYAGGNEALRAQAKKLAARGIQTYDPAYKVKLSSHLMNQMQPLRRVSQQRTNVIRVPERVQVDLYKLRQAQQSYFDRFGREPADSELSEHLGVPLSRINHLRKFMKQETSESNLRAFAEEGEEPLQPGTQAARPEDVWLEYVHHDASPIDQKIMEWKTGYNGARILPTQEIARRLRISPSAVSQRASRMARKMTELQEMRV